LTGLPLPDAASFKPDGDLLEEIDISSKIIFPCGDDPKLRLAHA
jgi:hypothetical protein